MLVTLPRPFRALAPALALFALAGQAAAEGPEIAQIAPERSFLVLSVADWPQLRKSALDSNLGRLWSEPRIAALVKDATKPGTERLTALLSTLNADVEDLKHPTGHVGAALFLPDVDLSDEDASAEPLFLFVAEFGEHASDWQKLLEKYIDRGLDDRTITTDDDTYRDVKITIIKPVYLENPHANCVDECAHEKSLAEALGGTFADQRTLSIARIGDSFIFSSDLPALEHAIDHANGRGRDALAENPTFRDTLAQHEPGALAHGVFFAAPLLEMFFEEFDDEPRQMFDLLGVSNLRAMGASLRLDTADAVAEVNVSLLAPAKQGILELMDEPGGAFEPPAWVPPGAASVSRFSFRFDGVMKMARATVQALPGDQRTQAVMVLDQASGILTPLLEALAPTVYAVTNYRQPYSAESVQSIYVIDLRDELTVTNTLDFLVGQAGGIVETREFDGSVIYSSEMLPIELAASVGFGRLFIGSTAAVENALRAAGQQDAPRLSEEQRFRDATRPLAQSAIMYSYIDVSQWLRWMWWSWENADKILIATLDGLGIDAEYREEILRQSRENTPEWQKNLPPVELITRHLGDMVYELRSDRDGFSGRMMILKPREVRD
jgi:hypothetical protein